MKEYKGRGGSGVTIDDENLYIKQLFIKESCTFADITGLQWTEPVGLKNGYIDIFTRKHSKPPHSIFFSSKTRDMFSELYDIIAEKTDVSKPLMERLKDDVRKENEKAAQRAQDKIESAERQAERVKQMDEDGIAYCPKCKSTSLSSNKKGFGIGKAVFGAALTGGIGLIAGNIGARKVRVTCLKCGHQFKAGK